MKSFEKKMSIVVCVLSLILFLYLLIKSILFSCIANPNDLVEFPTIIHANVFGCLLISIVYVAIIYFISIILSKNEKLSKDLLIVFAFIYFIFSISYTYSNGYQVWSDQAYLYYGASDILTNVRGSIGKGGYFYMFPYQLGMMLYEQIVFLINGDIDIANLCIGNAIANTITYISGYFIVSEISNSQKAKITYLLLMLSNLPLIIYTTYIYNECISIMFCMLSIWMFIKHIKTNKTFYFVLNTFFISLACIFRMTSFIILIAEVCIYLVKTISNRKPKAIIQALLTIVIAISSLNIPIYICNKLYDSDISKGMPYVLTIAMGMQNDEQPGWYNDYNYSIYHNVTECDNQKSTEIAKDYISQRVSYFLNNPQYAIDFYSRKFDSQWLDQTYQSFWMTKIDNFEKGLIGKIINYGKGHDMIELFMDAFQIVVYCFSLCYVFLFLININKTNCIEKLLLPIIVIGGALFSLLWEAKGRYILQYFVFMTLISSIGLTNTISLITNKLTTYQFGLEK